MAKLTRVGVTGFDSLSQLAEKILIGKRGYLVCADGLADDDGNVPEMRKRRATRPGLIGAVQADGNQWYTAAAGDGDEAGLQRRDKAVAGARAFGKDQDEFASLQAAKRFFEAGEAAAFAVNRNGIEKGN